MIFHQEDTNQYVALKLHDVEEPFTRKIALSHWLDCIFSNCPTLAICFHRQGRVLGYHVVRTVDIPYLKLRDLPVLVGRAHHHQQRQEEQEEQEEEQEEENTRVCSRRQRSRRIGRCEGCAGTV